MTCLLFPLSHALCTQNRSKVFQSTLWKCSSSLLFSSALAMCSASMHTPACALSASPCPPSLKELRELQACHAVHHNTPERPQRWFLAIVLLRPVHLQACSILVGICFQFRLLRDILLLRLGDGAHLASTGTTARNLPAKRHCCAFSSLA